MRQQDAAAEPVFLCEAVLSKSGEFFCLAVKLLRDDLRRVVNDRPKSKMGAVAPS